MRLLLVWEKDAGCVCVWWWWRGGGGGREGREGGILISWQFATTVPLNSITVRLNSSFKFNNSSIKFNQRKALAALRLNPFIPLCMHSNFFNWLIYGGLNPTSARVLSTSGLLNHCKWLRHCWQVIVWCGLCSQHISGLSRRAVYDFNDHYTTQSANGFSYPDRTLSWSYKTAARTLKDEET